MSDRGSFVSQWFYCERCRDALHAAAVQVLPWVEVLPGDPATGRVVVGNVRGLPSCDIQRHADMAAEAAANTVCHPTVFTVITEDLRVLVYGLVPGEPPVLEVVSTAASGARALEAVAAIRCAREAPGMNGTQDGAPADEWTSGGREYRTLRLSDGALEAQVLASDAWATLTLTEGSVPLDEVRVSAEQMRKGLAL